MKTKGLLDRVGKQTHVRVSERGRERIEECFKVAGFKTRRAMLDAALRGYSESLGVEPLLERRWRRDGKRKAATRKARKVKP